MNNPAPPELSSHLLAKALEAKDAAAVAFALRNDHVVVPHPMQADPADILAALSFDSGVAPRD